ncbi:MAG: hypothetical protein AAFZ52_18585, partial [Bacteroidota bacterium]
MYGHRPAHDEWPLTVAVLQDRVYRKNSYLTRREPIPTMNDFFDLVSLFFAELTNEEKILLAI